jgi:cyclopropane-fatty-acyl-phospholipid synthase
MLGSTLARLRVGSLVIALPDGRRFAGHGATPGPSGQVDVHAWRCLWQLLVAGEVAFAEAYIRGEWSTPDLAAVVEVVARNRDAIAHAMPGFVPARALNWVGHQLRANTKAGSRRNVAAHYDLGNDFYGAWLDADMVYSSAIWPEEVTASAVAFDRAPRPRALGLALPLHGSGECATPPDGLALEAAQSAKLDRVIDLLRPERGHRILEIGIGWGALASRLARRVGAHVTGLTLSRHQVAHVRSRAEAEGLTHLVEPRFQDYRDVAGTYDRIVSIEMIEAVGRAYWPLFFQALRDRLCPHGHAIIQAITIDHAQLEAYEATPDFIQVHIFPGGMLPSIEAMAEEATRVGLSFTCVEQFGMSYARTLAEWRRRFVEAWPQIEMMGFNEAFRRKWEYYLGYCEGGFRAGAIDVGLYRLTPIGR